MNGERCLYQSMLIGVETTHRRPTDCPSTCWWRHHHRRPSPVVSFVSYFDLAAQPSDAHCSCHIGTAKKQPVADRVKPSFV